MLTLQPASRASPSLTSKSPSSRASIRCSPRDGKINDVQDIKIGMVDASAFAFVADGRNGLRVLQIFSPEDSPNSYGFSPRPTPKLIATYRTARPGAGNLEGN